MKDQRIGNDGAAHSANAEQQRGFTLIEMSIVLVIIGLIIGGIIKGQQVVNNARVKIQVAQIDAIKAAVNTFLDTYNFYPGDYGSAPGTTTADLLGDYQGHGGGNEDGVIGAGTGTVATPDAPTFENAAAPLESGFVWTQLQQAQLLAGIENGTLPGKIPSSILWMADFDWGTGGNTDIVGKMIRIQYAGDQATATAITSSTPSPAVPTVAAEAIDGKYDDGDPSTGTILAGSTSNATNCCNGHACGPANAATATAYGFTAGTAATTSAAATTGGSASAPYCVLFWQLQ